MGFPELWGHNDLTFDDFIYDRVKRLTGVRFGLSHSREHEFSHSVKDSEDPLFDSKQHNYTLMLRYLLEAINHTVFISIVSGWDEHVYKPI